MTDHTASIRLTREQVAKLRTLVHAEQDRPTTGRDGALLQRIAEELTNAVRRLNAKDFDQLINPRR